MVKNLRKRHLQIWIAWAFVFPVAIVISFSSITKQDEQPLLQPTTGTTLPALIKQWDKENYRIALKTDSTNRIYQIEWVNKTTLAYPTATVYLGNASNFTIGQSVLIGRIEARGVYYFPLDTNFNQYQSSARQLVLYDYIHQQIIDTLNLFP